MIFRRSYFDDFKEISNIIKNENKYLSANNINQWQDNLPTRETIKSDIENGYNYVLLDDNSNIIGTTSITYHYKNDLDHPNDINLVEQFPYAVIHRTALLPEFKDTELSTKMMQNIEIQAAKNNCSCIKIDTHSDNKPMLKLLDSMGFRIVARSKLNDNTEKVILMKDI